jgi:phosphoribosylamine--glycine ligase
MLPGDGASAVKAAPAVKIGRLRDIRSISHSQTSAAVLANLSLPLEWHPDTGIVVVMCAKGYPATYQKGTLIEGIGDANAVEGVHVFHAGTTLQAETGQVLAAGGRVLGVTALGKDITVARDLAYKAVAAVKWEDGFCRKDIGWRAVQRL